MVVIGGASSLDGALEAASGRGSKKVTVLNRQTREKRRRTLTSMSVRLAAALKPLVRISTLNLKKVKRAWDCCASILERLDRGEVSIDKAGNKCPYDEGTKFASKITLKQTILTEAQRAEAEIMYRKGMTMSAIADTFGCHYTTIGKILRQRNVPIREK